jgi:hypothetical protein
MNTEERIARLETQVRRLRGVLVLAGLVVAGIGLMGMVQEEKVPDVIRAKRFVVPGKVVPAVSIAATEDGGLLAIRNAAGKQAGEFHATEDGGNIAIRSADGKPVGMFGPGENGGFLGIYNKTVERACTMRVDEYGNGEVGAWDRKGKRRTLTPGE